MIPQWNSQSRTIGLMIGGFLCAGLLLGVTNGCSDDDPAPVASTPGVGTTGGSVTAPSSSAIAGSAVMVPAGAISGEAKITLKAAATDLDGTNKVGPAVEVGPSGTTFVQDVFVTLPFANLPANARDTDIVVLKNNGTSTVEVPVYSVDSTAGTVTVRVRSFSTFQAVVKPGFYTDPTPTGNEFPRSAMVAMSFQQDVAGMGSSNFVNYVKNLVSKYNSEGPESLLNAGIEFPLRSSYTDSLRGIAGLKPDVIASWLDPLDDAVDGKRFGANCDYITYFGDDWNSDWNNGVVGSAPQFNGSGNSGWIWSNHEYISGAMATATSAPTGQQLLFANWLKDQGILENDVTSDAWDAESLNTFIRANKQQLGGSWFRIVKDTSANTWSVDRSAPAQRYDGTSDTLVSITGYTLSGTEIDDYGNNLPANVVPGILGDCSGGTTPWGTIVTAEENVQGYYGDLEPSWTSQQKFVPGQGFDAGAAITLDYASSAGSQYGQATNTNEHKRKDSYSFLVEIDPGMDPSKYYVSANAGGDGMGHRKIGSMGRAHWENAAFVTAADYKLEDGKPIVCYAGDDRRSGRIYKWVSDTNYSTGMTKAQVRAMLDTGKLYVSHFANLDNASGIDALASSKNAQGYTAGQWIELSLTSTDIAPNAAALGDATKTVGQALQDVNWNGMGGYTSNNQVLATLFTAATKIGAMELNRPEDVEWNPVSKKLYIAFTNHGRKTALNQDGVMYTAAEHDASVARTDRDGAIFELVESNSSNPGAATTFTYKRVWRGSNGGGLFEASSVDNLMIDREGGVWFGTDGNEGRSGSRSVDSVYYLDLNTTSRTYGMPFRVASGPSDSEFTGPALSSDQMTLFGNIQHPGEDSYSNWPANQAELNAPSLISQPDLSALTDRPLSSMVGVRMPSGAMGTGATNWADMVKALVSQYGNGTLPGGTTFPMNNEAIEVVAGLGSAPVDVVVKWGDRLTNKITGPRFGANCDYLSVFGDGWNSNWTGGVVNNAPQFNGSGSSMWVWVNHEYISNNSPSTTSAPTGQCLTMAQWLKSYGVLANDVTADAWADTEVDAWDRNHKRSIGGTWFKIEKNATSGAWELNTDAAAKFYDGTSQTLVSITGYTLQQNETDDMGNPLPTGVVPGILGDCSGGTTPWGTIITAEENVQGYYGDLQPWWSGSQQLVAGSGASPGKIIEIDYSPSQGTDFGRMLREGERKQRESYGFLVEIDPGVSPSKYYTSANSGGDGVGHRKIGSMGRARWENATIATDGDFKLVNGQPIVMYAGNDRRSAHIYKWVSASNYTTGMTKAQVRALLDTGSLYVAHFADLSNANGMDHINGQPWDDVTNRGNGTWIELDINNTTQIAPNAAALGDAGKTVGAALRDVNWNGLAGYANQNQVLATLFTASLKLGVMELNRPEDLEWNPNDLSGTPRLYIAFTNHTSRPACNQQGVLTPNVAARGDAVGAIFVMEETNAGNPGASTSFTFWSAARGSTGTGAFSFGDADNIMVDKDGGVWFGTDGYRGVNGTSDSLYYLDTNPANKALTTPTWYLPFRVISGPNDSEATGPCFSPDMGTIFFNVQHPGESLTTTWPANQPGN